MRYSRMILVVCLVVMSVGIVAPTAAHEFDPGPGGGGGGAPRDPLKIAVFFWASDLCKQTTINKYIRILHDEGYSFFYNFKDTRNFGAAFNTVDSFEQAGDEIFFYLIGHGWYEGGDSNTYFRSDGRSPVSSSDFRTMMDGLETSRKAFLVDSCYAGGWVDDFKSNPYLAMASCDKDHNSTNYYGVEGTFSSYFWDHVSEGGSALQAFAVAKAETDGLDQNAVYTCNSDSDWFEG